MAQACLVISASCTCLPYWNMYLRLEMLPDCGAISTQSMLGFRGWTAWYVAYSRPEPDKQHLRLLKIDTPPADEERTRLLVADMGVGGSAGPVSMAEPGVRWKMACRWYWKRTEVPLKDGGMLSGSCSLQVSGSKTPG